ncbi:MAG: PfkB family carbohydrate kinase [Candidatus Acidiferrum sp.]|jgi:rfaE bifunctional protein kinase chain/domain
MKRRDLRKGKKNVAAKSHRAAGKAVAPAAAGSPAMDLGALADYVSQFSSRTIVLLGDFVADEFQFGEISRVSREAPVLILRHSHTRLVPGGGANAANNFAALGARVLPVTAVGEDGAGEKLREHFRSLGIDVSGIVTAKNWATPTKTRFLAGWAHTAGQQVLRVDREPNAALPENVRAKLQAALAGRLTKADALAVSDYGFGVATPALVRQARALRKAKFTITLDARHNLHSYAKSQVTSATPNEAEVEALHHTAIGVDVAELQRCAFATQAAMNLDSLLVTRGRDGMALFEPGNRVTHIPIHGAAQAVDVTGAGDTVLAAYTLALVCGAPPLEAAHIANIAGGLVVMKRGTATVSQKELLEAIRLEIVSVPAEPSTHDAPPNAPVKGKRSAKKAQT